MSAHGHLGITGLEDYLGELGAEVRANSALGADPRPPAFTIGPATGIAPPAPGRLPDATYQAMEDRRMWEYDRRWYSPTLYRDVRVCVRQPEFGGPWVTENTQYLYDNDFKCHGWRGAGASDGIGATLLSGMTSWSIPCTAEGPQNAFQYERYQWAKRKIAGLAGAVPADPQGRLNWLSELAGLLAVGITATNVRTDGDRFSRDGFFGRAEGWLAAGPAQMTFSPLRASFPGPTNFYSLGWNPFPGGGYPDRLFPTVAVGLDKAAFCPQLALGPAPGFTFRAPSGAWQLASLTADDTMKLSRVGFASDAGALDRWAAAGAGLAVIPLTLSFGSIAVITLDNEVQRLLIRANAFLDKDYLDWIKTSLDYYRDRMTAFYAQTGGTTSAERAESLRLIQEGSLLVANTQAATAATGAWSGLSTVLGLITMIATAVNAAIGAVVAVVTTLLVSGLTALSTAMGYGVVESLDRIEPPWPPFVRILEDPCAMPASAEGVPGVPATRFLSTSLLRRAGLVTNTSRAVRDAVRAGTCPPGTTGTYPNCTPTSSEKQSSGGLLVGAAVLLLLSRLVR